MLTTKSMKRSGNQPGRKSMCWQTPAAMSRLCLHCAQLFWQLPVSSWTPTERDGRHDPSIENTGSLPGCHHVSVTSSKHSHSYFRILPSSDETSVRLHSRTPFMSKNKFCLVVRVIFLAWSPVRLIYSFLFFPFVVTAAAAAVACGFILPHLYLLNP